MDIWKWVVDTSATLSRGGEQRLSELLWRIPDDVCEDRHALVDSSVPEALALGAAHPWVQVYVRHWQLQSRVLHRMEVRDWIGEAVRLLDDASRPEARDCPQSICVTQDLVTCYGYLDGPGYAPERIAATDETLARIDPRWPCFACISSERAGALLDAGRAQEAVDWLNTQWDARIAVGAPVTGLVGVRAHALLAVGRAEEALAVVETHGDTESQHSRHQRDLLRALAFLALDREEETRAALPPFSAVEPTLALWRDWLDVHAGMIRRGWIPNDAGAERLLGGGQVELARRGVIRQAVDLALVRAELAVARGRRWSAEWALDEAQALLPELRALFDVPARLAALRAAASAFPARPAPLSVEEILAGANEDPERDLELAVGGRLRWPDDPRLVQLHAGVLKAFGREREALAVLRRFVAANPEEVDVRTVLAQRLVDADQQREALEVLEPMIRVEPPRWNAVAVLASLARRNEDVEEEERLLGVLHGLDPSDVSTLVRRSDLLLAGGRAVAALADLDEALAHDPSSGAVHWRRVVAGSITGQWDRVRASAAALEIPVESEGPGPIDERWGLCRLQWTTDAPDHALVALRTGPVTARVLEIAGPWFKERRGEEVVFDPTPVQIAEGAEGLHTFSVVATLTPSTVWSGLLDLVFPGAAGMLALRAAVEGAGAAFEIWRQDEYSVQGADGEPVPGLLAAYALALDADPRLLDDALRSWVDRQGVAAVWPELLQRIGDPARIEAQAALSRVHELWWGKE